MLYPRDAQTGELKIQREAHTGIMKHKKHGLIQFRLDFLCGPPLHEPGIPRAEQIYAISLRGDDKAPAESVKAKGMAQPLSIRRFRKYWGSHIGRFGERVMERVQK